MSIMTSCLDMVTTGAVDSENETGFHGSCMHAAMPLELQRGCKPLGRQSSLQAESFTAAGSKKTARQCHTTLSGFHQRLVLCP